MVRSFWFASPDSMYAQHARVRSRERRLPRLIPRLVIRDPDIGYAIVCDDKRCVSLNVNLKHQHQNTLVCYLYHERSSELGSYVREP